MIQPDRWAVANYNGQVMEIEMATRERLDAHHLSTLRAELRELAQLLPRHLQDRAKAMPGCLIMPAGPHPPRTP